MPTRANGRNWTESELVKVLSLYCQMPFGQMDRKNRLVIRFAEEMDRTPSSSAMKLVNFASFDPSLQSRGIRGMSNASRLDREVWDRFYGRWDTLAAVEPAERTAEIQWQNRPTSIQRTVVSRLGQGFFRNAVLSAYDGACCISGIREPTLLRASHIMPWSVSESRRLDPSNGICLNALYDAAFDSGLIAIDLQLRIKVSPSVRAQMPEDRYQELFAKFEGTQLRAPERFPPNLECLQYHLEHIYVG